MRSPKKQKTDQDLIKEAVEQLERHHIYTDSDWKLAFPTMFNKFSQLKLRERIMTDIRKRYCSFSLYQTFIRENNHLSAVRHSQTIEKICHLEGFNVVPFIKMILTWMMDFSFSNVQFSVNTLYIVGGPESAAEALCNSIVSMFKCVSTCDLNNFDYELFKKTNEEIKFIFFPYMANCIPFSDPMANHVLRGREIQIVTENGPEVIQPVKCLVHLKSLPPPHRMPTHSNQHSIIHFYEESNIDGIYPHDLISLMKAVSQASGDIDMECKNPYRILCNKTEDDTIVCPNCRRGYDRYVHHPNV